MAVVYRKSDRITLKVHDLTVKIAPLTFAEKAEAQRLISENSPDAAMRGSIYTLKCALKEVKGITTPDGKPYELQFENDMVADDCVDDLTNLDVGTELFVACLALLNGVPQEFVNPITGKKLEGVEIVKDKAAKK